ncbi:ustiloxin B cluster transcription factor ustR [Fusarium oxysporum f. sp. cubense]|uniref:Ustiloxin B cluster transcription factor ustR n=1 Tax=Fusarium oxysporum f. sp. cubense TaxID=61366 RepID=A0A559LL31_FUSOC|nr:ustiloxin B cluster transcription factor ustR [Fusarium oxysporum f. sp. cubense]
MSLGIYFFSLILSSEDVPGLEVCRQDIWTQLEGYANSAIKSLQTEVLAMNQQGSTTLLLKTRAMESITQLMVLEMAVAKTNESSMHLATATSLFEDIIEGSKADGRIDIMLVMAELDRLSWATLATQRPVWNTEQAALRFFFAILLWADVVSSTSLQTVPCLQKYYPELISYEYGGATTESLLRIEEYVGCEGWVLITIAETATLDVWKREEQINGTLYSEALSSRADSIYGALQDGLGGLEERYRI